MAVLEFIFSGFWIWLGSMYLIVVALNGLAEIIRAIRNKD